MRGEINTSSLELCFFRIKSSVIRNLFGIDLDLELTFIFSGFNSSGATSFDVIVSLWISSLIWSTWPLMLPSATRTLKVFDNLFNYEPSLLFHIDLYYSLFRVSTRHIQDIISCENVTNKTLLTSFWEVCSPSDLHHPHQYQITWEHFPNHHPPALSRQRISQSTCV